MSGRRHKDMADTINGGKVFFSLIIFSLMLATSQGACFTWGFEAEIKDGKPVEPNFCLDTYDGMMGESISLGPLGTQLIVLDATAAQMDCIAATDGIKTEMPSESLTDHNLSFFLLLLLPFFPLQRYGGIADVQGCTTVVNPVTCKHEHYRIDDPSQRCDKVFFSLVIFSLMLATCQGGCFGVFLKVEIKDGKPMMGESISLAPLGTQLIVLDAAVVEMNCRAATDAIKTEMPSETLTDNNSSFFLFLHLPFYFLQRYGGIGVVQGCKAVVNPVTCEYEYYRLDDPSQRCGV
ncbi:hypothetical protein L345_13630, partial [Ophiophagus hannah]